MKQSLHHPPRTIMEVFKMLPEGTLAELINGSIYMSPAPSPKHQRLIGKLYKLLSDIIEKNNLGEILLAPCDVYLDEDLNAVQPDLIFISKSKSSIVHENSSIHGAPDMLIEILSPGNSDHDRVVKKDLYRKFGVKEYWIINPDTSDVIGFRLDGAEYAICGNYSGQIISQLLGVDITFV